MHTALAATAAMWPIWWSPGWWDSILTFIPGILGFTVGGFAIVLALGAGEFGAALSSASKPDEDILESMLAQLSAAFCHFILMQITAIGMALIAESCHKAPAPRFAPWLSNVQVCHGFWGICWFFGIYSLALALSTAHWIFSSIKLLIRFQKHQGRRKAAQRMLSTGQQPTPPSSQS